MHRAREDVHLRVPGSQARRLLRLALLVEQAVLGRALHLPREQLSTPQLLPLVVLLLEARLPREHLALLLTLGLDRGRLRLPLVARAADAEVLCEREEAAALRLLHRVLGRRAVQHEQLRHLPPPVERGVAQRLDAGGRVLGRDVRSCVDEGTHRREVALRARLSQLLLEHGFHRQTTTTDEVKRSANRGCQHSASQ